MSDILVQRQAVTPVVRKIFKSMTLIGQLIPLVVLFIRYFKITFKITSSEWKLYFQDLVKKPNSSFLAKTIYICR